MTHFTGKAPLVKEYKPDMRKYKFLFMSQVIFDLLVVTYIFIDNFVIR